MKALSAIAKKIGPARPLDKSFPLYSRLSRRLVLGIVLTAAVEYLIMRILPLLRLQPGWNDILDAVFLSLLISPVIFSFMFSSHANKEMARELKETQHRFESLIQHTADAISILDLEGNLQMVNPAWEQLYGWCAEEVLGKTSPTLTGWDTSTFSRLVKRINDGKVFKREVITKRHDGTDVEVIQTESPIFSSDGKVVAIAFIAKDLTEFRKAEQVVLRTDKLSLAGELAAGIAHEIRNPLTAIQGYLQLMRSHFDQKYLDVLLTEVRRIDDITDEFLLLARPQVEICEFSDLDHLVHDVLTLMESEANMYSISIKTRVPDELQPLMCVRNQIKQVFINLIKNSIEAMPHGGVIVIEISESFDGVVILVSDDGPGISPDRLHSLGEPFYTTKERGTGLGLMVTYRIIQKHGGTIQVSSELGHGTTFRIFIPFRTATDLDRITP